MTKNTKIVVAVGAVLGALALCCGSCLIAGVGADGSSGGSASLPSGRYECVLLGASIQNGMLAPTITPTISFTVSDGSFTTGTGSGTVVVDGNVATFSGSDQDGWRGLVELGDGDARIAFSGADRTVPPPSMNSTSIIRCQLRR